MQINYNVKWKMVQPTGVMLFQVKEQPILPPTRPKRGGKYLSPRTELNRSSLSMIKSEHKRT